ncbi:MAG: SCO family protein [Candidatus Binataceae bacterium]|nr:SCO family protein [Candidatus Binataceae bacterium]
MVLFAILASCSHTPPAEIGSYPAANPNDCLPPIALSDQHGTRLTLASLKGKPVLIDFVYASCHLECPVLTSKFRLIANALGSELGNKITLVSITLDPEHDTPAVLLRYAKAEGAPASGWLFLTGAPAAIDQELALFRIKRMREPGGAIGHVAAAFLLGPDGHQIRQYDALQVSPKTVVADIRNALNG